MVTPSVEKYISILLNSLRNIHLIHVYTPAYYNPRIVIYFFLSRSKECHIHIPQCPCFNFSLFYIIPNRTRAQQFIFDLIYKWNIFLFNNFHTIFFYIHRKKQKFKYSIQKKKNSLLTTRFKKNWIHATCCKFQNILNE